MTNIRTLEVTTGVCLKCGKTTNEKKHYCSLECSLGIPTNKKECLRCAKTFECVSFAGKTVGKRSSFCSTYCYNNRASVVNSPTVRNSPYWRGGNITRSQVNWPSILKQVNERDKRTCQHCGFIENPPMEMCSIHHIVPYRVTRDNSLSNLLTLCEKCHMVETKKETELFQSGYYKIPISNE